MDRLLAPIQAEPTTSQWSDAGGVYVNRDNGKPYTPHHADEARFVYEDGPWIYGLAKGGEGGGKSVLGIIKNLERLRRGMNGIMVSPDLEHFKKSLWPEFTRWCPWQHVIPEQRYRGRKGWEPQRPFSLTFDSGATLYCGGIESPEAWEGPNVSFAHGDEMRRHKTAAPLKVLSGRVRIAGPNGEKPQLYFTTTPRKHWLYEYFGPIQEDGPLREFKESSLVIDLLTSDNRGNLSEGFVEQRRLSLTEAEARVLLEAAWEDIDDIDRFLASMTWWDGCKEELPPLGSREPMVLVADAGVSDDNFGLLGITRHPRRNDDVAVRYVQKWEPKRGQKVDFDKVEAEVERLCQAYYVVEFAYDPYQLHQMATRIRAQGRTMVREFPQGTDRLEADRQLLDLITHRRIAHDGNEDLRAHIDNADRKLDPESRKMRIVKRTQSAKVDLAICLSMGAYRVLRLPL